MANRNKRQTDNAMLDRARHWCAQAEQCESGVRQKLVAWGANADDADVIVDCLRDENYIDDTRYVRAYCESKLIGQGWGRQKVIYQLRLKHLPKDAIDKGLAVVDEERYEAKLLEVTEHKLRELASLAERERDRKLSAFLLSRGFTYGEINKAIAEINKSSTNN